VRNSLIKYLNQQLNIKALLFESGIGELVSSDMDKKNLTPSQMTNGLVGPWRTNEFVELMSFVKSQDISIAGFDVQRSGSSFNGILNNVAKRYGLDTMTISTLEARYGQAMGLLNSKRAVYDSLNEKTTRLINDYQKVNDNLSVHLKKDSPKDLMFTNITIENRISYLSYMMQFLKDRNWNKRWAARDSAMARNTKWLLDNIYRNQPVIIIGHNFHLGKYNENETVMGEFLKKKYSKEMYSIGIFAGAGSYHDNFQKEVALTKPDSLNLDIKHIIASLPGYANFIDIPDKFSNGNQWLDEEIVVNDTFIALNNANTMILSKTFDGLILLKKVSPPK
jgi:erythromycin esterase-like protein